jgi:hypothetical protein
LDIVCLNFEIERYKTSLLLSKKIFFVFEFTFFFCNASLERNGMERAEGLRILNTHTLYIYIYSGVYRPSWISQLISYIDMLYIFQPVVCGTAKRQDAVKQIVNNRVQNFRRKYFNAGS